MPLKFQFLGLLDGQNGVELPTESEIKEFLRFAQKQGAEFAGTLHSVHGDHPLRIPIALTTGLRPEQRAPPLNDFFMTEGALALEPTCARSMQLSQKLYRDFSGKDLTLGAVMDEHQPVSLSRDRFFRGLSNLWSRLIMSRVNFTQTLIAPPTIASLGAPRSHSYPPQRLELHIYTVRGVGLTQIEHSVIVQP